MISNEGSNSNGLCCCEYVDINNRRNHILGCCCACDEFDYCVERLITCKVIPTHLLTRTAAVMLDRIRVPWRGGAKQITLDAILPIILLPSLGYIAAHGFGMSVIIFTSLPSYLLFMHYFFMKSSSPTKFFAVWSLTSLSLIVGVFELIAVEMLEIRHDENIIFILLTIATCVCVCKTRMSAELSHFRSDMKLSNEFQGKEYDMNCPVCRKSVPPRTFHCRICHVCVVKRDLHCAWLDCCIGDSNHKWYLSTLLATISLLLLCSNLILTTACHPFVVWGSIMLPDDCTDIYFDIVYAVCFVTAIYCLMCMLFLIALLLHELWLISLGLTGHEWRYLESKPCCGLLATRPYSEGFFKNWVRYCRGVKPVHSTQMI
ncbi:zinc finger DHHC-type palmitoyltransferase GABPI [Lycorma delicatula]|uniref:zinc finger DHHC-type palmitoyltransferase GABPI n=1 Tax=Lycorma delicatula TaxID=130591 RepID=UPI003F51056A